MKKLHALYPTSEAEAVGFLCPMLDLENEALRSVADDTFKRAWYSIAFLYAGLHPDEAADHGEKIVNEAEDYAPVSKVEPRLIAPFYEQSGWPVVLAPIAKEAWRRYEAGSMKDEEFYCSDAQAAGMRFRERMQPRLVG
jgi:DNA (cytosine-5)-methyltransferase 1